MSTTYLRKIAVNMAAMLPDTRDEALTVLEYLRELADWEHTERRAAAPVVRLVHDADPTPAA